MAEILVGDIETNGLHDPNVIWMVGVLDYDTDEFTPYVGDDVAEGLLRLLNADVVIGHNFRKYDAVHVKRLTSGLIVFDQDRIIDTLELSRELCPWMPNHKLGTWGVGLDFPKLPHKLFERFTPEMVPYCERDCRLNKLLFDTLTHIGNIG